MSSPGLLKGYALEYNSVLRALVTSLDAAGEAGCTLAALGRELSRTVLTVDLHRVEINEHLTPVAARQWLAEWGLNDLGNQVAHGEDNRWRLTVPTDDIRYEGRQVHVVRRNESVIGSDFNPVHGRLALSGLRQQRRHPNRADEQADEDLRASMQAFGWHEYLPAYVDEHGTVIAGRRRLRIAQELGIPPNLREIPFGHGENADRERLKLMIASDQGHKPWGREEKEYLAQYLYGTREWNMTQIGELLQVSHQQVSTYIAAGNTQGESSRLQVTRNLDSPIATDFPPQTDAPPTRRGHTSPYGTPEQRQALAFRALEMRENGSPNAEIAAALNLPTPQKAGQYANYGRRMREADAAGLPRPLYGDPPSLLTVPRQQPEPPRVVEQPTPEPRQPDPTPETVSVVVRTPPPEPEPTTVVVVVHAPHCPTCSCFTQGQAS